MAAPLHIINKHKFCRLCGTFQRFHKKFSAHLVRSSGKIQNLTPSQSEHNKWQSVIGLEIHAQIKTSSKLFSGAATKYGASTNSQVSYFDAALPGTLPVLNKKCVEAGVLTALALGCDVNLVSHFDRKHYFYADLPAGYQITQYRKPLAVNGEVRYVYQNSHTKKTERRSARLVQIQLEQDSGKSLHDADFNVSLIDLNRAGIGLMEIITAPDFKDGDDASSFVRDLRDILVTIGTCDGRMSEGSLRVDANVSVHRPGEALGTRTEVKNLNSLRNMRLAIDHEIKRQTKILEEGGVVVNETLSFDAVEEVTVSMRDKEKVLDYRFMPEPNLPSLVVHRNRASVPTDLVSSSVVVLEDISAQVPELPDQRRQRLETEFGLSLVKSLIIVRAEMEGVFICLVTDCGCDPDCTATVLKNSYIPFLEENKLSHSQSPISNIRLAELIGLYGSSQISGSTVNKVLNELATNSQRSCVDVIEAENLWAIKDADVITAAIDGVFARNPSVIKAYRRGKMNQLDILQTKVLNQLQGKVAVGTVRKLIKNKLENVDNKS